MQSSTWAYLKYYIKKKIRVQRKARGHEKAEHTRKFRPLRTIAGHFDCCLHGLNFDGYFIICPSDIQAN
jgi:hypothetical protein